MPLTSKEMVKLLKRNGFRIVGQTGSHMKLKNINTGVVIIVPIHCREMKKGLELSILKKAGIERSINNE